MFYRGLIALLVFAFFTSCAPISFAPGTRSSPLPTSYKGVAKIKVNAETFVRAIGPAGLLSDGIFSQPGLEFTSYGEIQLGASKRISVNWVDQVSNDAPEGWKLQIVNQEGVSTITRITPTQTGVSYITSYTLELIVGISVPAGTPPGVYPVVMKINEVGHSQNTGPVYFNLDVQKSE